MLRILRLVPALLIVAGLVACARPEVHVHDRHVISFTLVESFGKRHPGTTLVLLDYHHDTGPIGIGTRSSNWVARLVMDRAISKVIWVSGRDLVLPNRNARLAWLRRSLEPLAPQDAASIESAIILADWHELEKGARLEGPLAVSLDLDLFDNDPGDPPERFVDETAAWIARQSPGLLTIALSSAYQSDPHMAWSWLERFVDSSSRLSPRATWHLEAGPLDPPAEGAEETRAWARWNTDRATFGRSGESFLPGSAIWLSPPVRIRRALLARGILPGDETARQVLIAWKNRDIAALEAIFTRERMDAILSAAAAGLFDLWAGSKVPFPDRGADRLGVALRIKEGSGDRGCLALYRWVGNPEAAAAFCAQRAADDPRYGPVSNSDATTLDLELSIFGPWREMKGPLDFMPGVDSLLLVDGEEITFLQAPVAVERRADRADFLSKLSIKAGLGAEGWKRMNLRFMRAATVWSRRPLADIENHRNYQMNEKK